MIWVAIDNIPAFLSLETMVYDYTALLIHLRLLLQNIFHIRTLGLNTTQMVIFPFFLQLQEVGQDGEEAETSGLQKLQEKKGQKENEEEETITFIR